MLLQPNRPPGLQAARVLQAARGCIRHGVACVTGLQARLTTCVGLQPLLRRVRVAILSYLLHRARAAPLSYLLLYIGLGLPA